MDRSGLWLSRAFLVSRILRICWLAVTFPLLAAATAALSLAAVAGDTAYQSVVAKRTFSGLRSVCVSLLQVEGTIGKNQSTRQEIHSVWSL